MKKCLTQLYGNALRVVVISNATNIDLPVDEPQVRMGLKTIGFISHLSRSKGVLEFLDIAERVCRKCPDVRAVVAGTMEEPTLQSIIDERLRGSSSIVYLGPVYGELRSRFYAEIDVFVFPTRYANEAEPMVINEALAHGVAVVARGRGCIESVVTVGGGVVIREGADFAAEAEALLLEWYQEPSILSSTSLSALANSAHTRATHDARVGALIQELAVID
jgi:glycosyltransferase involved in cell wall biosynthesis